MEFEQLEQNFNLLIPDFLQDYPDATEDIYPSFPKIYGPALEKTILVESDHDHDNKTRQSITGIIVFFGSTPVMWLSKSQSIVAFRTYAE